jgi:hypothetical protein
VFAVGFRPVQKAQKRNDVQFPTDGDSAFGALLSTERQGLLTLQDTRFQDLAAHHCLKKFVLQNGKIVTFTSKIESPLKRTLLYGSLDGAKYMKNSRDFSLFFREEQKK